MLEKFVLNALGIFGREESMVELIGQFRMKFKLEIGLQIVEELAEVLGDERRKEDFGHWRLSIKPFLEVVKSLFLKLSRQGMQLLPLLLVA